MSDKAIESAKLFILDYIASTAVGYKVNAVFNKAFANVYLRMGGERESSAFFYGRKYQNRMQH